VLLSLHEKSVINAHPKIIDKLFQSIYASIQSIVSMLHLVNLNKRINVFY